MLKIHTLITTYQNWRIITSLPERMAGVGIRNPVELGLLHIYHIEQVPEISNCHKR